MNDHICCSLDCPENGRSDYTMRSFGGTYNDNSDIYPGGGLSLIHI